MRPMWSFGSSYQENRELNQLSISLSPFSEPSQLKIFAAEYATMLPTSFPWLWSDPTLVSMTPFTYTVPGALLSEGKRATQPNSPGLALRRLKEWFNGPQIVRLSPGSTKTWPSEIHTRGRYRCTVGACPKTFKAKSDWRKHEEPVHCKTRFWPCDNEVCIARQTAQEFSATKQLFRYRRQGHKDKDQAKERLKFVSKNAYPPYLLKICPHVGLEPCSRSSIAPFKDLAERQLHLINEHKDFVYGQWQDTFKDVQCLVVGSTGEQRKAQS